MQIRVLPDTYSKLFDRKIRLEEMRRKPASFDDVLKELLEEEK